MTNTEEIMTINARLPHGASGRIVRALLAAVLVAFSGASSAAQPQPMPSICNKNCLASCAPGNAACVAACEADKASCALQVNAYKAFFNALGQGVSTGPIDADIVAALKAHMPNIPFASIKVGYTSKLSNMGITDCYTIYFSSSSLANGLKNGTLSSGNLDWVFHELRHSQQCKDEGGRDAYARRWFKELSNTLLKNPTQLDPKVVHDKMPMEASAESFATAKENEIKKCCLSGGNLDTD
jgi:hypothetical protein